MTFEEALGKIKANTTLGMRLPSWSPETVVCVQSANEETKTSPYLYIANRFGKVPWVPAFPEIFGNCWEVCAHCQKEATE